MTKLSFDELARLDNEIKKWGWEGFGDIAMIVEEDKQDNQSGPILSADDPVTLHVSDMRNQDGDLFVTLKNGDILHYRMTVERV